MNPKIKTVIVHKKTLIRKSLIALISKCPDIVIAGEAANEQELLIVIENNEVDIVLLSLENPLLECKEMLGTMQWRHPKVKIIILSLHSELSHIKHAISLGARGFINNECSPEHLIQSIKRTFNLGFDFDQSVLESVLYKEKDIKLRGNETLSKREKEILMELYDGKTEKEAALKLNISISTVHFHKKNLYAKTKSHNLADVLKFARENHSFLNGFMK